MIFSSCEKATPDFTFFTGACPTGTHYDTDTGECVYCPVGFYQDEDGMPSCDECPSGLTTTDVGARSADDCAGHPRMMFLAAKNATPEYVYT